MYRERISKANSENERFFHLVSQSLGSCGISSGMNRPPSEARPLSTTSSKESYATLESANRMQEKASYAIFSSSCAQVSLRRAVSLWARIGRLERAIHWLRAVNHCRFIRHIASTQKLIGQ
jgi:hypothetical protein